MKKRRTRREPYQIEAGTVTWARRRVEELYESKVDIGMALEQMANVPELLRVGADRMDNQPESDMARSFANDFERLISLLQQDFDSWMKDREDIAAGIRKYEEGEKDAKSA